MLNAAGKILMGSGRFKIEEERKGGWGPGHLMLILEFLHLNMIKERKA